MASRIIQSKQTYASGIHEFQTYGNGTLTSNTSIYTPISTMTIVNGNVGIGTNLPLSQLDVRGNIRCSNISVIGDFVTLNTITSNTEQMVIENAGTGPALKVTQTGNNSVAEFYDKESGVALFVGNNGNIGIGTNIATSKLDVNGIVKTQNPMFSGYRIGGDVAATNVILFDGVNVNIGGCYNSTNGRFTASIQGVYYVSVFGMSTGASTFWLSVYKNGAIVNNFNPYSSSAASYTHVSGSTVISLNPGDYLQVYVRQGTLYGIGNSHNQFTVFLIG